MSDKVEKFGIVCEIAVGLIWSIVISVIFKNPALGITLFIAAVVVLIINLKLYHSKNFKSDSAFITLGYLLAFWVHIKTENIILPALTYIAVVLVLGFVESLWEKGVDSAAYKIEKKLNDRKKD